MSYVLFSYACILLGQAFICRYISMAMYSFEPPFREATFCGAPSCVFGCAAGEKRLRNTALDEGCCFGSWQMPSAYVITLYQLSYATVTDEQALRRCFLTWQHKQIQFRCHYWPTEQYCSTGLPPVHKHNATYHVQIRQIVASYLLLLLWASLWNIMTRPVISGSVSCIRWSSYCSEECKMCDVIWAVSSV
jgi:hypothetical protein